MKLGVSSKGSLEECSGSSGSSLTTVLLASCSSSRNRDTRIAVTLQTWDREISKRGGVPYGLVKAVRILVPLPWTSNIGNTQTGQSLTAVADSASEEN